MNSEVTLSIAGGFQSRARALGRIPLWLILILLCGWSPPASRAGLIFDSSLGTPLTGFSPFPFDGIKTVNLDPQYAFAFEGTTYTSIAVARSEEHTSELQ